MNIIVTNDTRTEAFPDSFDWALPDAQRRAQEIRESINMDSVLCKKLRQAGHSVTLFDAREKDGIKPIDDPSRAASRLTQLIVEAQANGLVFDLHYFKNFDYGVNCLKQLRNFHALPVDMRIVVYSRFLKEPKEDYPRRLVEECEIPLNRIIDRHQKDISEVIAAFPKA